MPSLEKPKILVVDDRPQNLMAIQAIVSSLPCEMVTASSGYEALDILKTQMFALILLDVQMPQMDGFETARRIREMRLAPGVPLIFLTAIDQSQEYQIKAYRSGAADILFKPLDSEIVASKISIFLELDAARKKEAKERLSAENRAQFHETLSRKLFESNFLGLIRTSLDGKVVAANAAFLNLLGFTETDLREGQINWQQLTPSEFKEVSWKAVQELDSQGYSKPFEKEYFRKDGSRVPVLVAISRVGETDTSDFVTFVLDISEQKRAEAEKRMLEKRFRKLFEQSPVPVQIYSKDGNLLEANRAWFDLFQVQPEDIVGYNILQDQQVESLGLRAAFERSFQGETIHLPPFSYDPALIQKPGRPRWLEVHAFPVKTHEDIVEEVALYEIDFTDQIESMRLLEKNENYYRVLAESSLMLNSSLDLQETLKKFTQFAVPTIADWCDLKLVNEKGQLDQVAVAHQNPQKVKWALELSEKYPLDMNSMTGPPQVLRTGRSEWVAQIPPELLKNAAKDEEHLRILEELGFFSYICVPLRARHQVLGTLTVVTTKESGRTYTEQDLRLVEALAERAALAVDNASLFAEAQNLNRIKDEFLATLSHELRTPLNVIHGHAELLRSESSNMTMDEIQESIQAIFRNAQAQNQLVNDLLDVSAIIVGKILFQPAEINPAETLSLLIQNLEPTIQAKNIHLETDMSQAPQVMMADPTRFQQIVWNLMTNAAKFTPAQGSISLSLKQKGSHVELRIQDTGVGIDPEFIPYMFDRFRQEDSSRTRRFGGLGLGLSIVRHLVELHGGTVRAESQGKGKGSTFTVTLPQFPLSSTKTNDGPGLQTQRTDRQGFDANTDVRSRAEIKTKDHSPE